MPQRELDRGDIASRAPSLGDKRLAAHVVVEQIESLVDHLLLTHNILPAREAVANADELLPTAHPRVIEHCLKVFDPARNFAKGVCPFVCVRIDRVEGCPHRLGYLADLGKQRLTVAEDNEDVLASLRTSGRVHERLVDIDMVHVEVPAQNTPKDTLKGRHARTINGARHKLKVKLHVVTGKIILAILML